MPLLMAVQLLPQAEIPFTHLHVLTSPPWSITYFRPRRVTFCGSPSLEKTQVIGAGPDPADTSVTPLWLPSRYPLQAGSFELRFSPGAKKNRNIGSHQVVLGFFTFLAGGIRKVLEDPKSRETSSLITTKVTSRQIPFPSMIRGKKQNKILKKEKKLGGLVGLTEPKFLPLLSEQLLSPNFLLCF